MCIRDSSKSSLVGEYTIVYNPAAKTIEFKADVKDVYTYALYKGDTKLYDFTGSNPYEVNFTISKPLEADTPFCVKRVKNGSVDTTYGLANGVTYDGTGLDNAALQQDGADLVLAAALEGAVTFTLNVTDNVPSALSVAGGQLHQTEFKAFYLIGEFNNWKRSDIYAMKPIGGGNWEIRLSDMFLSHGTLYKLFIEWPGGGGERLPAYLNRAVQDPVTKQFCAQVWEPLKPYEWRGKKPGKRANPLIYECHIGMAAEEEKVGTFEEFRLNVLPKVAELGYDTLQIMALQEHPYYGSFGYQVANFYALSSRFGTPEEFKALVDDAHDLGIAVVMDIVHSHSVDNEAEGLGLFDGKETLYFYDGWQGHHPAWGSRCFDDGKDETK